MLDTIEIGGREYPVRFTLSALSKFEIKTKVNAFALSDPSKLSSKAAGFLVFCGIEAGCKAAGEAVDITPDDLLDVMSLAHVEKAFEMLTAEIVGEKKA